MPFKEASGMLEGILKVGVSKAKTEQCTEAAGAAYVKIQTEEAERIRTLKNLERSMLKKLDKSIIGRAGKFATVWVALVDGLSPFFIAIISLIPFIFSILGFIPVVHAIYFSMGITLFILFLLGIFLGKISKKNIIISGIKMLLVGLILTLISFVFKLVA